MLFLSLFYRGDSISEIYSCCIIPVSNYETKSQLQSICLLLHDLDINPYLNRKHGPTLRGLALTFAQPSSVFYFCVICAMPLTPYKAIFYRSAMPAQSKLIFLKPAENLNPGSCVTSFQSVCNNYPWILPYLNVTAQSNTISVV